MIRLHVVQPLAAGAGVQTTPEQAHYLTSVMRLAAGAELLVFNGEDGEWRSRIAEASRRTCRIEALEQQRPQSAGPDLELIVALIKRGRLEAIVEKATELGAAVVSPVTTERTNADRARLPRLLAIAVEAAEQTGRMDVPRICEPARLTDRLAAWPASRRLLFCDEAGDARPIAEALDGAAGDEPGPWSILIGPEGGFSPAERSAIRHVPQAMPVTLGPRILRADTAAIAALSLWQSQLGDWRGT